MAISDPRYVELVKWFLERFPGRGYVFLVEDPDEPLHTVVLSDQPHGFQARRLMEMGALLAAGAPRTERYVTNEDVAPPPKAKA